jgi:hypothetical protein
MKNTYLFSFQEFVNELRENPDKKEMIEDYERGYGPMPSDFKETDIYKKYVGEFTPSKQFKLIAPSELEFDFDWELLEQLIAASFSSDYRFEPSEVVPFMYHLYIFVNSGGSRVVKKIGELWSFQIYRLFEIYIEEQINLFTLIDEEDEKDAVFAEQKARLRKYRLLTSALTENDNFFTGLDNQWKAIAN